VQLSGIAGAQQAALQLTLLASAARCAQLHACQACLPQGGCKAFAKERARSRRSTRSGATSPRARPWQRAQGARAPLAGALLAAAVAAALLPAAAAALALALGDARMLPAVAGCLAAAAVGPPVAALLWLAPDVRAIAGAPAASCAALARAAWSALQAVAEAACPPACAAAGAGDAAAPHMIAGAATASQQAPAGPQPSAGRRNGATRAERRARSRAGCAAHA